jgi:hypothetical protein
MKTKKSTKPKPKPKPKARHTMQPAKRTTAKADAASNRHRAQFGDRQDSPAVELHALLHQVAAGGGWMRGKKKKANIQGDIAVVFAKKIWNIFESGDGAALRDFAALADAPVARPALEAAYAIRQDLEHYANEDRPRFNRAAVVRSIMSSTGCDQRTAEKATAEARLKELFGWRAGRPRIRS